MYCGNSFLSKDNHAYTSEIATQLTTQWRALNYATRHMSLLSRGAKAQHSQGFVHEVRLAWRGAW